MFTVFLNAFKLPSMNDFECKSLTSWQCSKLFRYFSCVAFHLKTSLIYLSWKENNPKAVDNRLYINISMHRVCACHDGNILHSKSINDDTKVCSSEQCYLKLQPNRVSVWASLWKCNVRVNKPNMMATLYDWLSNKDNSIASWFSFYLIQPICTITVSRKSKLNKG